MCKGTKMKRPKGHLGNNENMHFFRSDSLYMVKSRYVGRNVGMNPTVAISEYQIREIVVLMWFGLLKHGALGRPADLWEAQ